MEATRREMLAVKMAEERIAQYKEGVAAASTRGTQL
jgi:hypothetical protein